MNIFRTTQFSAIVLCAAFMGSPSCTKMSTPQKVTTILVTGGLAGTALSYYGQAEAASGLAAGVSSGMVSGGSILIANETYATPVQARRARLNAREALAAMPAEKRQQLQDDQVRFIAVNTVRTDESRGTAVMVYDIEEDKLAEPTVFDVRITPEIGSRVQFDNFVTEYVGGNVSPDEGFVPSGERNQPDPAPRP